MSAAPRYPSYRAPQGDREIVCWPSWSSLRKSIPRQREAVSRSKETIFGASVVELADEARRQLVSDALAYSSAYASSMLPVVGDGPLVVTGHQPELFHPGVWLKKLRGGPSLPAPSAALPST